MTSRTIQNITYGITCDAGVLVRRGKNASNYGTSPYKVWLDGKKSLGMAEEGHTRSKLRSWPALAKPRQIPTFWEGV